MKKFLGKAILRIALTGYMGLLFLLLFANINMLRNNRQDTRNGIMESLESAVERIAVNLNTVNNILYSVYMDNDDFGLLAGGGTEAEEYSAAYELNNTLWMQQTANSCLDGYYIIYGRDASALYKINPEVIPEEDRETLKQVIRNDEGTGQITYRFNLCLESGNCYTVILYREGQVMIAGVCCLSDDLREAVSGKKGDAVIWLPEDESGNNREVERRLKLREVTGSGGDSFIRFADGKTIYGREGSSNIWMIFCEEGAIWSYFTISQIITFAITLISAAAAVVLYRYLRRGIVKPIYQFVNVMEKMQAHSQDAIPDMNMKFYELDLMNVTLKNMVEEIRNQRIQYYEERLNRQEAELKFLLLQLKPHFFLNCLKTMNAMCVDAGMVEMQEFILKTAEHLRYFLQIDRKTIRLGSELDFVRNYVELQNMLTSRKTECEILMEEELEEWIVPVLCIQTFVENSIKHVDPDYCVSGLSIRISINSLMTEWGEVLDIMVSDSGQGYPQELLTALNERYSYEGNSVGINNIKRRCDLLYGERAEYSFYNLDGAVSELLLPPETSESREEET